MKRQQKITGKRYRIERETVGAKDTQQDFQWPGEEKTYRLFVKMIAGYLDPNRTSNITSNGPTKLYQTVNRLRLFFTAIVYVITRVVNLSYKLTCLASQANSRKERVELTSICWISRELKAISLYCGG
ncbi:hypothetical protein F2P79_000965 [Pimephales promelas]|nr:hypothetical protein F2P79_000965 [Pimephales promelas]